MEESLVWKTVLDKSDSASSRTLSLPPGAHTEDGAAEDTAAGRGEATTHEAEVTARQKRQTRQRRIQNSFRVWVEDEDEVGL